MNIRELSAAECRHLVERNRLARLACSLDGQPYVVPISCVYDAHLLYAFTMPGRKLDILRANPRAALLFEELGDGTGWTTVIAEGSFEELIDRPGHENLRGHAWSLLSQHANWWEPGAIKPAKPAPGDQTAHVFFRVHVDRMSGREAVEA